MQNKMTLAAVFMMAGTPAFAGEDCRSAKDIVRLAKAVYAADPTLTDVIKPAVNLSIRGIEGHATPSHLLYRYADDTARMPVVDGRLEGLEQAVNWSSKGEFCRLINGEMAEAVKGDTTRVSIDFDMPFLPQAGTYTVERLREGLKDGSKIMKAIAPKGLGFAMPGLKAIKVTPSDSNLPAVLTFSRNGESVVVPVSRYDDRQYVRLKDIRSAKADKLSIKGNYMLEAYGKFDPEEMAKAEARRSAAAQP